MALLVAAMLIAFGAGPAPRAAEGPAPGVHYLYLVRHGSYDQSQGGGDHSGDGLNSLGHQQAQLAGARMAALPIRFSSLVTSPFQRARETAEDIGRALRTNPSTDSLLRECTPTSDRADFMKNHSPAEIAACDSTLALAWTRYVVAAPEGDRHDVLECHSNVIRWFASRVVAGDPIHWSSMEIANASLTIIAVQPDGKPRLVMFSDVGHLPVAQQRWTGKGAGWGAR